MEKEKKHHLSHYQGEIFRKSKSKIKTHFFLKNNILQKSDSIPTKSNQPNEKPDLRLEIPSPTTNSDHSPVTVTTSISRRPAEDDTLNYAYDNPAMSGSPSHTNNGKSNESTF